MEDFQIIALYFARSSAAIDETHKKYGRLCYSVADSVLHCKEDAEECINDAYMAAWNTIPPDRPDHLSAFLCKIVRNLALKKYGQSHTKKRNRDLEVSLAELGEVLLCDGDISGEVELKELGGHISLFLRSQPPQERDWFVRRYWMFDSIKNIARDSHCSQSKIKSALMRTRKKLSAYLKNNYFDGGEV